MKRCHCKMALGVLLAAVVCASTPSMAQLMVQSGSSATLPLLHPHCNSAADDYAPFGDLNGKTILLTTERDGVARVVSCSVSGEVSPLEGTFNRTGLARGYVCLSASGEGYGVAYRSADRQSRASIVRVRRTSAGLDIG